MKTLSALTRFISVLTLLAALYVVLPGCSEDESPTAPDVNVDPIIAAWLRDKAVPFWTVEPGKGFKDLMPLKQMIGDARVVALGEATHGTREFFKMKHRLLEFLVQEMGFTSFAIEATWPESNLVNDYIQTGQGDPTDLLAGLYFWTWNTQEVLDMIMWMRENGVSFHGFDLQFPKMAIENVMTYVGRVDTANHHIYEQLYSDFLKYIDNLRKYYLVSSQEKNAIRDQLQLAHDMIEEREVGYINQSNKKSFDNALQSARLVQQAEHMYSGGNMTTIRDLYMAENVKWITDQEGPNAKIVLWAHNGHVRFDPVRGLTMGTHLRNEYGDDMVIIGFSFYEGSFNAISDNFPDGYGDLTEHAAPPPPNDAYAYYFHGAYMPRIYLDLRTIDFDSPTTDWIPGPRRLRSIGAVYCDDYPEWYYYNARLPEEFDIIIYFKNTTKSLLLPFPETQAIRATYCKPLKYYKNFDFFFQRQTGGYSTFCPQLMP